MPYGTIAADYVQSSTANTAPVFYDGTNREIGILAKVRHTWTGTATDGSFNISSVTDGGTGIYTPSFAAALSSTSYSVSGFSFRDTSTGFAAFVLHGSTTYSTSSLLLYNGYNVSTALDGRSSFVIHI